MKTGEKMLMNRCAAKHNSQSTGNFYSTVCFY